MEFHHALWERLHKFCAGLLLRRLGESLHIASHVDFDRVDARLELLLEDEGRLQAPQEGARRGSLLRLLPVEGRELLGSVRLHMFLVLGDGTLLALLSFLRVLQGVDSLVIRSFIVHWSH